MRIGLKPYHRYSKSARAIIQGLRDEGVNIERWKATRIHYDLVINWGSQEPIHNADHILNEPRTIKFSSNKVLTFAKLLAGGVQTPRVTTNRERAMSFGGKIYGRKNFSKGGRGIVIYENPYEVGYHDFYTSAVSNVRELRVHVTTKGTDTYDDNTGLISWSEKKPKDEVNFDINPDVKNFDKGYYFSLRDNDRIPRKLLSDCMKAIKSLGLDFCSFDVLETPSGEYVFLEANTASGVMETTLRRYVDFFEKYITETIY